MNLPLLPKAALALGLAALASCGATTKKTELPLNYGEDTSMRELVLLCAFNNEVDPASGLAGIAPDLSTFLQAELGRIQRFAVYCLWNDGTYRLASELAEVGELSQPVAKPPVVDLYLSGTVTANTKSAELRNGNRQHVYQVHAAVELQDASRIQLWGRNMVGSKVRRSVVLDSRGQPIGGFDPGSTADVATALNESTRVLLFDLVSELGHNYPITGQVTGHVGDQFAIEKGSRDGVASEQTFVVWAKRPGGIDIPLFEATAQPGAERTQLAVTATTSNTKVAGQILEALEQDPDWVQKHPGELYATSLGLGVPPEWSQARALEASYAEAER